jgi:hypothetical protein
MVTHDPRFARYAGRTVHLDGRVVEDESGRHHRVGTGVEEAGLL